MIAGMAVIAAGLAGAPASAAYLFDIQNTGTSVTITGSGSINLAGLDATYRRPTNAGVRRSANLLSVGWNIANANVFEGLSDPASFGIDQFTSADSRDGIPVGIVGRSVFIDPDYISGRQLGTSTATFLNQSIASLGLIEGEYVYRFGSGANADTITLRIGDPVAAPVPEPATWAMMIGGFGLVGGAKRRRRTGITLA